MKLIGNLLYLPPLWLVCVDMILFVFDSYCVAHSRNCKASIIKVVDSVTQETAGNDAPPESVSYVLSSTTNDDDAYYVRWADITECWVLRKPNNDFNPPPHFSSMSRQESFALHNFLERIDSKRSQLTGDIMSD